MSSGVLPNRAPSRIDRMSYLFIAVLFLGTAWLHLSVLLLAALFSYLALDKLRLGTRRGRWPAIIVFLVLVSGLVYGFAHFARQALQAFPEIANKAIPSIIESAKRYEIEVPFTDYDSLRETALETVKGQIHNLASFARYARDASRQALFLVAGIVVAIGLFLSPRFDLGGLPALPNNLYAKSCEALAERFRTFYRSFATVIGAQIVISAINTALTSVFVFAVGLPYAVVIIGVTFLCGLLPVVGNLISNTIIVGIGFTVSPRMALAALIFLMTIHKLEYFLNSHIIGRRIRNPLWLTLIGLVIGEKLMGIPGMILAPVVLHYLKIEASAIPANAPEPEPEEARVP